MATLLRIDSSPLAQGVSFSRQLTAEFVEQWKRNHPGGKVITRDLAATSLSPVDAEWIGAAHTPKGDLTSHQREILALSNELIGELKAADEYVIGVSMHNFSIPAALKLWIDQVVRAGETFSYEGGAPAGMFSRRKPRFWLPRAGFMRRGRPHSR